MDAMQRNETPGGDKGLFARMSRVMGRLARLPKNGFNDHFKYAFVTDGDVADAVRAALVTEGVAFFVSQEDMVKDGNRTTITFKFTFACETGEMQSCLWRGEAIDTQDKGIAKAATAAEKYFLLKTFILSTGDDPDTDTEGPAPKESKRQSRQPASQPAAPQPSTAAAPAQAEAPAGVVSAGPLPEPHTDINSPNALLAYARPKGFTSLPQLLDVLEKLRVVEKGWPMAKDAQTWTQAVKAIDALPAVA